MELDMAMNNAVSAISLVFSIFIQNPFSCIFCPSSPCSAALCINRACLHCSSCRGEVSVCSHWLWHSWDFADWGAGETLSTGKKTHLFISSSLLAQQFGGV